MLQPQTHISFRRQHTSHHGFGTMQFLEIVESKPAPQRHTKMELPIFKTTGTAGFKPESLLQAELKFLEGRLFMKYYLLLVLPILIVGCSSTKPRTKFSDPAMRVMVDPDGLQARDYIRIVNALKESGKWFIVDRRDALKAIFKEQKMIHRERADQFLDEEKYSNYGKLYGVGGVVVGHVDCVRYIGWFNNSTKCVQNLAIVSTNSGEVIASAEGENDEAEINWSGDIRIGSNWSETVDKLNNNFPKNFEKFEYTKEMHLFRQETKENAIRSKEELGREKAEAQW